MGSYRTVKSQDIAARVQRLMRLGVPLDPEYVARIPRAITVIQAGGETASVFQVGYETGIVLEIAVEAAMSLAVEFLELELPWCRVDRWLEPERRESGRSFYAFAPHLMFHEKRVLNHRITGLMRRGNCRQGILLGIGVGVIPREHPIGSAVKGRLVIADASGRYHFNDVELIVLPPVRLPVRHSPAPRRPLMDCVDPGSSNSVQVAAAAPNLDVATKCASFFQPRRTRKRKREVGGNVLLKDQPRIQ